MSNGHKDVVAAAAGWRRRLCAAALPLAILAVCVVGYLVLKSRAKAPESQDPETAPPVVEVWTLPENQDPKFFIEIDGTVAPKQEVTVAAEVLGRIKLKHKAFRAGAFIRQGEPLLEIDPHRYELELKRTQSELAQVDIDLAQLEIEQENNAALKDIAEIEVTLSQRELDRMLPLLRRGTVTESTVDEAKRKVKQAENSLRTVFNAQRLIPQRRKRLEAEREVALARQALAQDDLNHTKISAPTSGVISMEAVEQDDFVQRGAEMLKIEDTTAMEVKINLRSDDLFWLWSTDGRASRSSADAGDSFRVVPMAQAKVIYTLAGRQYEWNGFLSRYEGAGLDEATRTVPCRVQVDNPVRTEPGGPPTLVRGMFVKVRLSVTPPPSMRLLKAPEIALRPRGEVWTAETGANGEKLAMHRVSVIRSLPAADGDVAEGGYVLLDVSQSPELTRSARIVVSPLPNAVAGMAIRSAPAASSATTRNAADNRRATR